MQPRHPKGSPQGGEWVSEKGHSALLSSSTPLTQGQEYAVSKWRDTSAYRRIAERLRFGDEEEGEMEGIPSPSMLDVTTVIEGLDSAIAAQEPLAQDIVVHRGLDLGRLDEDFYNMDSDVAVDDFLQTYSNLEDASFVATTVSARVAAKFTGSSKHAVVLKIRVPKGAKVLPIKSSENFGSAGEEEVLLPRGTRIRLLRRAGSSPHLDRAAVVEAEVVQ
jgi:hypothetical protein